MVSASFERRDAARSLVASATHGSRRGSRMRLHRRIRPRGELLLFAGIFRRLRVGLMFEIRRYRRLAIPPRGHRGEVAWSIR